MPTVFYAMLADIAPAVIVVESESGVFEFQSKIESERQSQKACEETSNEPESSTKELK